jgi:membrane-bound lytic murein transglycosylase B
MIGELLIAGTMAFSSPNGYKAELAYLQKRLRKEGYDISLYLKDPRFEIYELAKPDTSKASAPRPRYRNYADTTQSWYMRHDSLESCADFYEENYGLLRRIEEKTGKNHVNLVSQTELETNRGKFIGKYPVFNALVTKCVQRTGKTREVFVNYLLDYMKLCADTTDNITLSSDPFANVGSSAGAMGPGQLMPSVIIYLAKRHAIDSDGDGLFDPYDLEDAWTAMGFFEKANGYNTQLYNPYDRYYGSSIKAHSKALNEVLDERMRHPIKVCPIIPEEIEIAPPLSSLDLAPMRLQDATQETAYRNSPGNRPRRGFLSKGFFRKARG